MKHEIYKVPFMVKNECTLVQCRPEDNLTSSRFGASVCRQCFATCIGDLGTNMGPDCFSADDGIPGGMGHFSYDLLNPTNVCDTTQCPDFGRQWWSASLLDCQQDAFVTAPSDCNYSVKPERLQMSSLMSGPEQEMGRSNFPK